MSTLASPNTTPAIYRAPGADAPPATAGLANLSIFDKITDPKETAKQLGAAIVESKVFGCSNSGQGEVLAWECLVLRIPPLRLAQTYHLIMGKLTMRADAMLAGLVERGGTYVVKSRTPEAAAIEITHRGNVETFALTWEEAKKEPFAYEEQDGKVVEMWNETDPKKKKEPTLKTKYSTPRARMQMLWARVVSDGVRTMAPEVNSGRYTPEEFDGGDVIEGVATPVVEVPAITPEEAIKQAEAAYAAQATVAPTLADKAPPAIAATPTVSTAPTNPEPPAEVEQPGYATKLQRMELDRLWAACLIPPVAPEGQHSQAAILRANYKVESARSLTQEQAATLIANLTKRAAKMAAETAASATNVSELDKFSVTMTKEQRAYAAERIFEILPKEIGRPLTEAEELAEAKRVAETSNAKNSQRQAMEALPATEEQCNLIRGLARTVEQTEHGTMQRLVDLLKSKGISKFAELSQWSANRLIDALQTYQMEAFFTASIENWRPVNAAQ
jgi:hypothetical protein